MLMTQREVEERMYVDGIQRARMSMDQNEEHGEAHRNPYAATVYRDFVLPLAEVIIKDRIPTGPGRYRAHILLLKELDAHTLAYLSVRRVLSKLMERGATVRSMAYDIGATIHQEMVLDQFAEQSPDLYHVLTRDFARRRTKDTRHRMTVFKMQAKAQGIEVPDWGVGHRDTVGLYILHRLQSIGLVTMDSMSFETADGRKGKRKSPDVFIAPDVIERIDQVRGIFEISRPAYGPCVEPPLDWDRYDNGGFHTERMRRRARYIVKAPAGCRELLRDRPIPTVLRAANALQRTAWTVNTKVLQTLADCSRAGMEFGEVVAEVNPYPKPTKPVWMAEDSNNGIGKADRSEGQEQEFRVWKREMAEWYTQAKLRGVKWGRYRAAIQTAQTFAEYPALYFVYFLDSRGRTYPLTYGLSPQGSDIQKALLKFATGKPLKDQAAEEWFLINGANRWGFDKAPLADRAQWSRDRHDQIMAMAADPVNNAEWRDADKPLQFLAWAFEYAEWKTSPDSFESAIPVGLDGSCNGLQHLSAMLRDRVGGEATNLCALPAMQDIYQRVADSTVVRLRADTSGEPLVVSWLEHGVTRKVVKRPVMTTPYGIKRASAVKYVIEDYLRPEDVFDKSDRAQAAKVLMDHAWEAIGDVVTKSREAMKWFTKAAKDIVKVRGEEVDGVISWVTPSGFIASQAYYELVSHQIDCKLFGDTRIDIRVMSEGNDPSSTRHASGMAPNFVHSMDASHMHLVAAASSDLGIDALAMIHDDFGTHAADTQAFFHLIREKFVMMYKEHDPIGEFHERYPETSYPPAKGDLNLEEVLQSDFFFS